MWNILEALVQPHHPSKLIPQPCGLVRYGALVLLFVFIISSEFLLGIRFTPAQVNALISFTCMILVYNGILQRVRIYLKCDPQKFNPLHFSLIQMILDLTALMLLVYFTGGIETPLSMLFVFHMIIGSPILLGTVIYSIATSVIVIFSGIVFGE